MAWIEFHQSLVNHPKTKRAARLLGIPQPHMIGLLGCLWLWALEYAQDGDLTGFTPAEIAEEAKWSGNPDEFLQALLLCGTEGGPGFCEQTNGGRLVIHDWYEYAGKLIERRAQDAERKRRGRANDVRRTSAGHPADVPGMSSVTVPYPTVPHQEDANAPAGAGPAPKPPRRRSPDAKTDGAQREANGAYRLAQTLATVCQMDFKANQGRLLREAKTLTGCDPPATPALVTLHYGAVTGGEQTAWWWVCDWRGKGGEWPQPATIRETWGKWDKPGPVPTGRNGQSGGHDRLPPALEAARLEYERLKREGQIGDAT